MYTLAFNFTLRFPGVFLIHVKYGIFMVGSVFVYLLCIEMCIFTLGDNGLFRVCQGCDLAYIQCVSLEVYRLQPVLAIVLTISLPNGNLFRKFSTRWFKFRSCDIELIG